MNSSGKRSGGVCDDSMPPAKRTREGGNDDDASSSGQDLRTLGGRKDDDAASSSGVDLNEDALSIVMEFLSPRELFNTAFTCTSLRDKVTTKLVVQSAMISGGHSKSTIEELHRLMSAKAVHVPSPLRLLRLINGKRCEFCLNNKVNYIRPCIGTFACWSCVTERGLTRPWKMTWARYRDDGDSYDVVFNHPRVASNTYGDKHYMWDRHRSDNAGERIGPLVTFGDVDRMVHHDGGVENYLQTILRVPPAEDYNEFNDAYTETKERAERAMAEREEKKRAARQRTNDNRRAKIEKMIDDLAAMLDDPFRDAALERRNLQYKHGASLSKVPCLRFILPFVNRLMEPYIKTPSKIRKKILKEIADEMNGKLRLIAEKRFLALEFLSEKDSFEAALKGHFSEKLTSLGALLKTRSKDSGNALVDDKFFGFLENDRLLAALVHLKDNDLSFFLMPEENVVRKEPSLEKLAKNVWFSKLDEDASDDGRFARALAASPAVFGEARLAIEAYTLWLQEKHPNNEDRRNVGRSNAFKSDSALSFLLSRNFEGLNKHQESAYNSWLDYYWR